jgi:hypothetical protein
MTRRVEKVGGGSRLNDAETWLTNSSIADVAVVWAKLDGEIRAHRARPGAPSRRVCPLAVGAPKGVFLAGGFYIF